MRRTRRAGRKVHAAKLLHALRTGGHYCPLLGVEPASIEENVITHADNVRATPDVVAEGTVAAVTVHPRQEGSLPVAPRSQTIQEDQPSSYWISVRKPTIRSVVIPAKRINIRVIPTPVNIDDDCVITWPVFPLPKRRV